MPNRPPNRLSRETSPYLLQHADNPVDWFPWGSEALDRAGSLDLPIFLSVGYSACHWCHVMERESFKDEETATLMNANFVCIKVDREERPDVDAIYMDAVQTMTGRGGWPMSAFLTPQGRPFYAGTYYPKEPMHGMPSFRQVLAGIAEAWRDRRDEIEVQAGRITEALQRLASAPASPWAEPAEVSRAALARLTSTFDVRWGGFGAAPKFPQPMVMEFLLRQVVREAPDAAEMVAITLDRMADGGMYDQLGGGFSRYSTDPSWHVPHFEKMLYDNAQLAQVYVRAWQVTHNERYKTVATETLDYVLREMRDPEGGFWSSQDADSEGVEGKFYAWSWGELTALVGSDIATVLGALPEGNWPEGAQATNVLWRPQGVAVVAARVGKSPDLLAREVEAGREALRRERELRVHPAIDDKVLASWNAMAIRALAEAGRAFGRPDYMDAAIGCANFVLTALRDPSGRLLRSWRSGKSGVPGFADDHALMASACLALYETTFQPRWFKEARDLADRLLVLFLDEDNGGFFQTGSDTGELVVRPKELSDGAVPSGNSAAAEVLARLALFTGDESYQRASEGALALVTEAMSRAPTGFGTALCALDLMQGPATQIAIIGDLGDPMTLALVDAASDRFQPNAVLAVASPADEASRAGIELLADRIQVAGVPTAFVCERFVCRLPVTTPEALTAQLRPQPGGSKGSG
jgi:uncharacterized protein YyaL (SSP411 family)